MGLKTALTRRMEASRFNIFLRFVIGLFSSEWEWIGNLRFAGVRTTGESAATTNVFRSNHFLMSKTILT